jgi:hypothetical protein
LPLIGGHVERACGEGMGTREGYEREDKTGFALVYNNRERDV